MMKRTLSLIIAVILLVGGCMSVSAAYGTKDYFCDNANLVPQNDETRISLQISGASGKYEASIVILTHYNSTDLKADAEKFYKKNNHAESGVLLLYCLDKNEAYILTVGACNEAIDAEKQDELFDAMAPFIKAGYYTDAFQVFADRSIMYIENFVDENGPLSEYEEKGFFENLSLEWYHLLLVGLFLGVVIGFVSVMVMKSKLRSVQYKVYANNYIMDDTMRVTREGEIFLYRTVTAKRRPKNNSGGGSGRGGRMHFGGSGRKF